MSPLEFALAVHVHQPVGNFDRVFREHVDHAYKPFLSRTRAGGLRPITLHLSGPLLDWLEEHDPAFLDEIAREVSDGDIEVISSGRYEPVLVALSRADRVDQIRWMNEALSERFGTVPNGLWLTERVWEQDLAADLADADIDYALLDDRHFLATGLPRAALDRPFRTEADGRGLTLLSIDERLRYLIPFSPVDRVGAFLRTCREEGMRSIVLGDDGEKFGGWPGTHRRVYEGGWLDRFLGLVDRLRADGTIELVTTGRIARERPGGLAYPAPGSYREMEEWTLPREAALELERLRAGERPEHPLIRGGHWRGFQIRYPLSNRMHKLALALSRLCREKGDPPGARRAIGRAQCNDAYWHGVFGGVYLPHLRQAVWRELARAEAELRRDEPLCAEVDDVDFDGHPEVRVHGPAFSAVVSPLRGGAIESLLRLDTGENDADVLARSHEAYHGDPGLGPDWAEVRHLLSRDAIESRDPDDGEGQDDQGTQSIHDLLPDLRPVPPVIDGRDLGIARERVGDDEISYRLVDTGIFDEPDGRVAVRLEAIGDAPPVRKQISFGGDGSVSIDLEWAVEPEGAPPVTRGAPLVTEIALAWPREVVASAGAIENREQIVTLARSERGYEEIVQGELIRLEWPSEAGRARVTISREASSPREAPRA